MWYFVLLVRCNQVVFYPLMLLNYFSQNLYKFTNINCFELLLKSYTFSPVKYFSYFKLVHCRLRLEQKFWHGAEYSIFLCLRNFFWAFFVFCNETRERLILKITAFWNMDPSHLDATDSAFFWLFMCCHRPIQWAFGTLITIFFNLAQQPPSGPGPPHSPGFWIIRNDVPQSVGLLWTSDQLVAETSSWQNTTLTTDRHPYPRWNSNPQSQQASGRRPTP